MNDSHRPYPVSPGKTEPIETVLESIDEYIVNQSKKLVYRLNAFSYGDISDVVVDELAQRARIKLWYMLKRGMIHHPYSYVRRIIHNEFIDMKRQHKPMLPFIVDDEASYQSPVAGDPADEIIQQMEDFVLLQRIARMVMDLPPRQQLAMICFLRDMVDDQAQLARAFCKYHIDITGLHWPAQTAERQLLRASLTVARHKLARQWLMTTTQS